MEKHGLTVQVCKRRVLLGKRAEAGYCLVCALKESFCRACAQKLGIAEQVCRRRVLLDKCPESGYCTAGVKKQGIAGQVCTIRVLPSTFTDAG